MMRRATTQWRRKRREEGEERRRRRAAAVTVKITRIRRWRQNSCRRWQEASLLRIGNK